MQTQKFSNLKKSMGQSGVSSRSMASMKLANHHHPGCTRFGIGVLLHEGVNVPGFVKIRWAFFFLKTEKNNVFRPELSLISKPIH